LDGELYLFIHQLSAGGDAHVTIGGAGTGPGAFSRPGTCCVRARWVDNQEELACTHDGGLLCIDATGYPHGVDRVVRVAEVDLSPFTLGNR